MHGFSQNGNKVLPRLSWESLHATPSDVEVASRAGIVCQMKRMPVRPAAWWGRETDTSPWAPSPDNCLASTQAAHLPLFYNQPGSLTSQGEKKQPPPGGSFSTKASCSDVSMKTSMSTYSLQMFPVVIGQVGEDDQQARQPLRSSYTRSHAVTRYKVPTGLVLVFLCS